MLDLGFSEMMVIAVVALVVIGPERLPKVARTVGHLVGRMQRYVNDVKADIGREMELDELRKFRQTVEETAGSVRNSFDSMQSDARSTGDELAALANFQGDIPVPVSGATVAGDTHMAGSIGAPDAGNSPGSTGLLQEATGALSSPAVAEWVEPTVSGAMASRAQPAIYVAPTSLAMATLAERAIGQQRLAQQADQTAETAPAPWSAVREA